MFQTITMELCTTTTTTTSALTIQAVSKLGPTQKVVLLQNPNNSSFSPKPRLLTLLARRPPLSVVTVHSRSPMSFAARATPFEETSNRASYGGEERDSVATLEDVSPPAVEKEPPPPQPTPTPTTYEASEQEEQTLPSLEEFFEKLNIDTSDPYPLVLYGSVALFILWLSSAIVGAVDAIPVFPKLMELVGLGYTFWFSYRYLIFKSKREELFAKFEELKDEVIG